MTFRDLIQIKRLYPYYRRRQTGHSTSSSIFYIPLTSCHLYIVNRRLTSLISPFSMAPSLRTFFIRELSLYFVCSLCFLYICVNVAFNYFSYVQYIMNLPATNKMKALFNYLMTFFIVLNLVAIVVNVQINWYYRNFRINSSTESPVIFYFMCVPLLVLAFVTMLYMLLFEALYQHCEEWSGLFYVIFILIVFIAIVHLLIDTNGIKDTGEQWTLNLSNFIAISLSIITLTSTSIYDLIVMLYFEYNCVLKHYFPKSVTESCFDVLHPHNSTFGLIYKTYIELVSYYRCLIIILSLSFIPYLLVPLKRSLHFLRITPQIETRETVIQRHQIVTDNDILLNILVTAILITLRINFVIPKQSIPKWILHVCECTEYGIVSVITIYIIMDVRFWVNTHRRIGTSLSDQIILWTGMLGELMSILVPIIGIVAPLYDRALDNSNTMRVLKHSIQLVQVISQTMLIELILQRNIKKSVTGSVRRLFNCFNPIINLVIVNFNQLVWNIVLHFNNSFDNDFLWYNLFIEGTVALFRPLTILYRAYSVLILVKMLIDMK